MVLFNYVYQIVNFSLVMRCIELFVKINSM